MREEMISRGKNLKQAIGIGLELMDAKRSQVNIEIIQNETNGVFGIFGKKPAVVRLIKKAAVTEPNTEDFSFNPEMPPLEIDKNQNENKDFENKTNESLEVETSKIWIKDGQVFCKESPTHFPTITPAEGVSLYINGKLVKKTTVLMEKDLIKVELPNKQKEITWSIRLDSTKMEATLQLEPGYRKEYQLIDQEPCSHINLEFQIKEETINHLQLSEIDKRMKELGINTGIQNIEIQKALEATEPSTFTIAKGIPPQKGEDGWFECIVETELKQNGPKLLENGGVDHRELITFPNVEIGQLIGIIHPPKHGQAGYTVTGKEIQQVVSKKMVVLVKNGIEIIDQGTKIIAMQSGRPYVEYRGGLKVKVSVIPRLLHSADVDIASGNLRYFGDIEVRGNVKTGMTVEALKDILVYGTVEHSTLTAGNQMIVCNNVFNSRLIAGNGNQLVKEIAALMGKLSSELKGLASAVKQVYQSPIFKTSDIAKMGLSSLIRILLENKFKTLPPLIKELCELIEKAIKLQIVDSDYAEIRSSLIDGFIKMFPRYFNKPEDIEKLINRMEELYDLSKSSPELDAHIILPYALNCELVCSGDISILGKGSINSNIHAGGKVQINRVLRGGEIFAKKGLEAEEVGAIGDLSTCIRVPVGQSIKIKNAIEGTNIRIGNHSYQFTSSVQNVFARVNKEDRLLLF